MATVKMKKLSLFVLREHMDELLRELMLLGCVEISEPDTILREPGLSGIVRCEAAGLETKLANYRALDHGLEIISRRCPSKLGKHTRRPKITQTALLDKKDLFECLERARALVTLEAKLRLLITEEARERGFIESLEPWSGLTLSLDCEGTEQTSAITVTVPASVDPNALGRALSLAAPEAHCFVVSSDSENHYLSVIFLRERRNEVFEVLSKFGFAVSHLKKLSVTASEAIKNSTARVSEMQTVKRKILTQIEEHAKYKDTLRRCYDLAGTEVAHAEAAEKLLFTRSFLYLTGWMPAPSESALLNVLSKYLCAWELCDPSSNEPEAVPVISASRRGDTARLFNPLRINTKYMDVIKEDN